MTSLTPEQLKLRYHRLERLEKRIQARLQRIADKIQEATRRIEALDLQQWRWSCHALKYERIAQYIAGEKLHTFNQLVDCLHELKKETQ